MSVKTVKVDLPGDIFDVAVNVPLIHQVVVAQQAAARQGTHATKTRGMVRGSFLRPSTMSGSMSTVAQPMWVSPAAKALRMSIGLSASTSSTLNLPPLPSVHSFLGAKPSLA